MARHVLLPMGATALEPAEVELTALFVEHGMAVGMCSCGILIFADDYYGIRAAHVRHRLYCYAVLEDGGPEFC